MLAHSPSLHEKQQGVITPSINTQIFRENMNFWNMNQGRQPFSPKKLCLLWAWRRYSHSLCQLSCSQRNIQSKQG